MLGGWKGEKRALDARIALLERECAESVELVDELATELERRGREGVEEGAELAECAFAFFLPPFDVTERSPPFLDGIAVG